MRSENSRRAAQLEGKLRNQPGAADGNCRTTRGGMEDALVHHGFFGCERGVLKFYVTGRDLKLCENRVRAPSKIWRLPSPPGVLWGLY